MPNRVTCPSIRTYIIVPILDQERYPLAEQVPTARLTLERLGRVCDITCEFAIGEGTAGGIVYNGGGFRVVGCDGLEDGEAWKSRSHTEARIVEPDVEGE